MDSLVENVVAFIAANREWAGPIAFVFALAETVALVSIVIPSTAILFGVGAIVATGALDFLPLWIGGALGAIVGSGFSYWLGRRYGGAILGLWPLRNHPGLVERGARAYDRYGAAAILIGHFVGPLRAVVFLMAGIVRLRLRRFLPVNIIGAVAWAWAIPKSGEVGGNLLGWLWRLVVGG